MSKYLENITNTFNGYVYKDEDAFYSKKGICYISECCLDELEELEKAEGRELTDDEIVSKGIGDTYDTIVGCVKAHFDELSDEDKECGVERIADIVFNEVDWQCIETLLCEMTY